MTIEDILAQTEYKGSVLDNELQIERPFDRDKKKAWLEFYRQIGFKNQQLIELSVLIAESADSIPQSILDQANKNSTKVLKYLQLVLLEYTKLPYSDASSAKLIQESILRATSKYSEEATPLTYTTRVRPVQYEVSKDITGFNSFNAEDYGHIDIVGGLRLISEEKIHQINSLELLRADEKGIELKLIFSSNLKVNTTTPSSRDKLTLTINPEPALHYEGQTLPLDSSSVEFYALQSLFEQFPNTALDDNIIDNWGGKEEKQTLYDASRRINKKLQSLLETSDKVVWHKNSKFWFDEQFNSLVLPLTKTDKP